MAIYKIVVNSARIVGFQWDEGNARKSFDKHGVSQSEAEQVFFNEPFLVIEDVKHSRPGTPVSCARRHQFAAATACHIHTPRGEHQDPCDLRTGHASQGAIPL